MAFINVLVGTLFVAAIAADPVQRLMCMRFCGNESYKPVCGQNEGNKKVFSNLCEMKNAECSEGVSWNEQDMKSCLSPIIPRPPLATDPIFLNSNIKIDEAMIKAPIKLDACDFFCLASYSPVCGFDGNNYQVFTNGCEMSRLNCVKSARFEGVEKDLCKITDLVTYDNKIAARADPCDLACPEYYLPVCGYDGQTYKTFGNLCFLQAANCKAPRNFQPAGADMCQFNRA